MIKQGIRNYIKNLKYVFTPLGTIALGVVFGLSLGIPMIANSLSNLLDMIIKISQNTTISLQDLIDGIWDKIVDLDWEKNPIASLQIMLDTSWLTNAINSCLESISIDVSKLEVYISGCIDDIGFAFTVFVLFTVFGFIGGYFLTKWLVRREIAKRTIWKYLLVSFIDSVLSATLVTVCLWILLFWSPSIIFSAFGALLLFGSIALFEAYITHAWKKVEVKKVVSIKNIAKLVCSDAVIFVLAAALVGIVIVITNVLVGLFVGIALIEIAFIVIGLNAESYVKGIVTATANDTQTVEISKPNDKNKVETKPVKKLPVAKPDQKTLTTKDNANRQAEKSESIQATSQEDNKELVKNSTDKKTAQKPINKQKDSTKENE